MYSSERCSSLSTDTTLSVLIDAGLASKDLLDSAMHSVPYGEPRFNSRLLLTSIATALALAGCATSGSSREATPIGSQQRPLKDEIVGVPESGGIPNPQALTDGDFPDVGSVEFSGDGITYASLGPAYLEDRGNFVSPVVCIGNNTFVRFYTHENHPAASTLVDVVYTVGDGHEWYKDPKFGNCVQNKLYPYINVNPGDWATIYLGAGKSRDQTNRLCGRWVYRSPTARQAIWTEGGFRTRALRPATIATPPKNTTMP